MGEYRIDSVDNMGAGPKNIRDIRAKRLHFLKAAEQAEKRAGLIIPGRPVDGEVNPLSCILAANILTWVLGEEHVPWQKWEHNSPHAKGWLKLPVENQEYVEKPTW